MSNMRIVRFNFLLSKHEDGELLALAKEQGLTKSAWLRSVIRTEYRRQLEEAPHRTVHRNSKKRARNNLGADGAALRKAATHERISLVRKPK